MKVEYKLFPWLVPFFLVVAAIYGHFTNYSEAVGLVGLPLTGGLCALVAFFLWQTGKKLDERPEDDPYGISADAEGDYGTFTPHSWWPLWLGLSAAIVTAGLAFGWWMFCIGVPFLVLAVIGWTYENFHGEYAH